jgi:predicted O-methyltransferase YrrM
MKKNNFCESVDQEVSKGLDEKIKLYSEMIYSERHFLNVIIHSHKPKKLLEIGVSAGGSSAIILNAIRDFPESKLYSHDYNNRYYRDADKLTGFAVKEICPELSDKWNLLTGGTVAEHIDEIGGGIDFVLLDTMHSNPGEFLDFLMILPYLEEAAVVVIHDISLHMGPHDWCRNCTTCGVLFAALKGGKSTPEEIKNYHVHEYMMEDLPMANIGAVKLDAGGGSQAADVLRLLSLPWAYKLTDRDVEVATKHFMRHYGEDFAQNFTKCVVNNHERIDRNQITSQLQSNERMEYKKKISIFGIPLMKIIARYSSTKYKLFGILTILRISRS